MKTDIAPNGSTGRTMLESTFENGSTYDIIGHILSSRTSEGDGAKCTDGNDDKESVDLHS